MNMHVLGADLIESFRGFAGVSCTQNPRRHRRAARTILGIALALSATKGELCAQGTGSYFNVESPQRKPITVARVAGHDYVVACNTPDNAIEIYDTHTNNFVTRVQTGAEPISVVWNAALGKLYTCNFLGDSITMISLSAPSGSLVATLERTVGVGDEPNHIAFAPDNGSLFVTLGSQSAVGWRLTSDLSVIADRIDLLDTSGAKAIKEPGVIAVMNNKSFTLNNRSGNANLGFEYGIRVQDFSTYAITELTGLGTNNFSMAFTQVGANGADLYVVGTDARTRTFHGEANVRNATFGFTGSLIYKIPGASNGTGAAVSRDLNADANNNPVLPSQALCQPTDLALYEPGGVLTKIYVAAFGSGRVGVVPPNAFSPGATISQITISPVSGNPMSGPRGLAIKYANGPSPDPGDRLYVLNRLDNSVSVINPVNDSVVTTFPLQRDPTPLYIRNGREFLYGAHLSGSGFVSCASCHIDGRSDWLAWELSDNNPNAPIPAGIREGVIGDPGWSNFPQPKGFLVTQTLQGMANFETQPEVQDFFSNEPLHWRADRASFNDFQGAFVNLLGGAGISDAQMKAFRLFAFSIAYPPNPEQPLDRTFSGSFGPDWTEATGSGARRGMKLYHTRPLTQFQGGDFCKGRSCVECHALPEGSNNKITLVSASTLGVGPPLFLFPQPLGEPLETPSLRLLRQKEMVVERFATVPGTVRTAAFGLEHEGIDLSITSFIGGHFSNDLNGTTDVADVAQFVRELDTGVGPLVGRSYTIDQNPAPQPLTTAVFDLVESQARVANSGVAIQFCRIGSAPRGFWFDLTQSPPLYREELGSSANLTRTQLLALISQTGDRLVVHATPLGSERRFAWPGTGLPTPLSGNSPSNIMLEPVKPNTAYASVPQLTKNWVAGTGANDFNWLGGSSGPPPTGVPTPPQLQAIRLMQAGLIQFAPQLGLTAPRHEAPRRFRVALDDGRHGARLQFTMGTDSLHAPPNSLSTKTFDLPIYPTDQVNAKGKRIWETAVEADPLTIYELMLGGPNAPNVAATLNGSLSGLETIPPTPLPAGTYNPGTWNAFLVRVVNEDATFGSGGWQAIKIQ